MKNDLSSCKVGELKEDDRVLVMDDPEEDQPLRRHFAWYEDGRYFCFANGATSWSRSEVVIPWKYCEKAEEE